MTNDEDGSNTGEAQNDSAAPREEEMIEQESVNDEAKDCSMLCSFSTSLSTSQKQQQAPLDNDSTHLIVAGYTADGSSSSTTGSSGSGIWSDDAAARTYSDEDKLGLVIDLLQPQPNYPKHTNSYSTNHPKSSSSFSSDSYLRLAHRLLWNDRRSKNSNRRKRRKHGRKSSGSKKRKTSAVLLENQHRQNLSWMAPSPIHPDIDISLTQHVAVQSKDLLSNRTDAMLLGAIATIRQRNVAAASSSETTEIASSIPALSQAVLHYFADLRQEIAVLNNENVAKDELYKRHGRFKHTNKHRKTNALASPARVDRKDEKSQVHMVSDVVSFSDQPYRLEDALDLTELPRLLLEAASPHRVIHVNAAFSKKILCTTKGTRPSRFGSSNAQEWMEIQNEPFDSSMSFKTMMHQRTLQEALEEIIPSTATIPLTCYPVLGAGRVTHYLIEATTARQSSSTTTDSANNTKLGMACTNKMHRKPLRRYKPFEAVG